MNKQEDILKIFLRLLIWISYFIGGYFLYTNKGFIPSFLKSYAKLIYPISIFWLQIRIKNRERWLPFTSKMSTSQLWFKFLPIIASLITVLLTFINLFLLITRILLEGIQVIS